VVYNVFKTDGTVVRVANPANCLRAVNRPHRRAPSEVAIHVPAEYVGGVLALCHDKRGCKSRSLFELGPGLVTYELPFGRSSSTPRQAEGISRGYASMDYSSWYNADNS